MSALSFFAPRSLPPDLAAKTRSQADNKCPFSSTRITVYIAIIVYQQKRVYNKTAGNRSKQCFKRDTTHLEIIHHADWHNAEKHQHKNVSKTEI